MGHNIRYHANLFVKVCEYAQVYTSVNEKIIFSVCLLEIARVSLKQMTDHNSLLVLNVLFIDSVLKHVSLKSTILIIITVNLFHS